MGGRAGDDAADATGQFLETSICPWGTAVDVMGAKQGSGRRGPGVGFPIPAPWCQARQPARYRCCMRREPSGRAMLSRISRLVNDILAEVHPGQQLKQRATLASAGE